ncbi:coiled-coil domain-containing protein 63-like isoform X2 [Hyperolius riggenbachi]|uniref:coiled-coil domain-containing protein 63-like isoform X2 n=1 Tax=Hyperolius riggenbachi TaxID=752182 RepID=UPI0035A3642B
MPVSGGKHRETYASEDAVETDLRKEKTQLRNSETTRNNCMKAFQITMQRQQREINILEQQHKELQLKVMLTKSQGNVSKDQHAMEALRKLLKRSATYDHLIEREIACIDELENKVKEIEENICIQKKAINKKKNAKPFSSTQRKISQLETHLQQVTANNDNITTIKSIVRDQISDMQSQKEAFLKIHHTLQQKLEHIKTIKKRVTRGTLLAQEEREAMLARVQVLRERATTALHQYDSETEKISRTYDHEEKLGTFLRIKSADCSGHEDKKKRLDSMVKAREKISRERCEIIRQYQDACEKIFTLTGQKDLDAAAKQYIGNEIKNSGSFTLLKELIFDVQGAEENVQAIKNEITTLQNQHKQMVSQQDTAQKLLEQKIMKTAQEANGSEKQSTEKYQHLQQIFSSLQSLFNTIQCDPASLKSSLAAETFAYLNCTKYFCRCD